MHAEQYKLLDTLILLEARSVVTHYKSLGGLFLNEYRHMLFNGQRTMTRVQTQVGLMSNVNSQIATINQRQQPNRNYQPTSTAKSQLFHHHHEPVLQHASSAMPSTIISDHC